MAYRPDAAAFTRPQLLTDQPIVTSSTADEPTEDNDGGTLEVGQTWRHDDTGHLFYWSGSEWLPVVVEQVDGLKLSLLFELRDMQREMFNDVE